MATLAAVLNWRPRTPFYYGWLVLGMSFVASFGAVPVTSAVFGGIQLFILEDTGWKRSQISGAITLGAWASGLLGPLVGRLTDRFGPRWLMPVGAIASALCLYWLGSVQLVWHFWVAYILGRGVTNSTLLGVVPRTVAVNFFRRHRNIALSLASEARPIGAAILIQVIALIATHSDWRTAYRYLGFMSLAMLLPIVMVMRRRPEDIGLLPDGARPGEATAADQMERHGRRRWLSSISGTEFDWKAGEALRTRAFWLIAATAFLVITTSSTISFSLAPYLAEEAGLSKFQAAGVLSVETFLVIASLGWAMLANRFTPRVCLMGVLVIASALILYLLFVRSLPMAFVFAALWGLSHGPVGTLESMILAQFFGRASYGTIIGALGPLQSFALGLGPSLSAVARDLTGSYSGLFMALMGVYLVGTLLIFFARPPALPARAAAGVVARAK